MTLQRFNVAADYCELNSIFKRSRDKIQVKLVSNERWYYLLAKKKIILCLGCAKLHSKAEWAWSTGGYSDSHQKAIYTPASNFTHGLLWGLQRDSADGKHQERIFKWNLTWIILAFSNAENLYRKLEKCPNMKVPTLWLSNIYEMPLL